MRVYTIDSSVIIKWIFPEKTEENHVPQALLLLRAIKQNTIKVLQPTHWLAETIAVIVRLQPEIAGESIDLLSAMEFPVINIPEVYQLACQLSERYEHHLFDTLYHAVALYSGNAQFVTADEKYYRKTYKQGAIVRLDEFSSFDFL